MSSKYEIYCDNYTKYFNYFSSSNHSLSEIKNYITTNNIPSHGDKLQLNLNVVDPSLLNILFHIVMKAETDEDCLEKLKYLIEEKKVNYKCFDYKQRRLPFYTCAKGFLLSTQYLIEKMKYDINFVDISERTLFFEAIFHVNILEYLDNHFPKAIFFTDEKNESCIFELFRQRKNKRVFNKEKIKEIFRYIIERRLDIDSANNNKNSSFINLICKNETFREIYSNLEEEIAIKNSEETFKREQTQRGLIINEEYDNMTDNYEKVEEKKEKKELIINNYHSSNRVISKDDKSNDNNSNKNIFGNDNDINSVEKNESDYELLGKKKKSQNSTNSNDINKSNLNNSKINDFFKKNKEKYEEKNEFSEDNFEDDISNNIPVIVLSEDESSDIEKNKDIKNTKDYQNDNKKIYCLFVGKNKEFLTNNLELIKKFKNKNRQFYKDVTNSLTNKK